LAVVMAIFAGLCRAAVLDAVATLVAKRGDWRGGATVALDRLVFAPRL
jgi:hypothetical protein